MEIKDFKISLLDQICRDDILEYLDYMSLYQKDGKDITNDEKGKKRMEEKLLFFRNAS